MKNLKDDDIENYVKEIELKKKEDEEKKKTKEL
jgi:hypothetical protein